MRSPGLRIALRRSNSIIGGPDDGGATAAPQGQRRADGVVGGGDGDADHAPWPYRAGSLGFFGGTSPVPPRRMLTPLPTPDGRPPEAVRAKPLT